MNIFYGPGARIQLQRCMPTWTLCVAEPTSIVIQSGDAYKVFRRDKPGLNALREFIWNNEPLASEIILRAIRSQP